jgi:23S rRNA (cytosine1962-C5)-methyltransferase
MNNTQIPITISEWDKYTLLDSGNGKKLEQFGDYILVRPDSQSLWSPRLPESEWQKAHAVFEKKNQQGSWIKKQMPDSWKVTLDNVTLELKLTPFGHVGIFPEQYNQWQWLRETIKNSEKQLNILSLFGYTGVATVVAAYAGAKVTHVDASKPSVAWASENLKLSGLSDKPVRWIIDDAFKFVKREIKRESKYDAIIMDPPKFGHGPQGEVWKFEDSFPELLENCRKILSPEPSFVLVNAYAIPISAITLGNIVSDVLKDLHGKIEYGELGLQEKSANRILSTALFAKWHSNNQ